MNQLIQSISFQLNRWLTNNSDWVNPAPISIDQFKRLVNDQSLSIKPLIKLIKHQLSLLKWMNEPDPNSPVN